MTEPTQPDRDKPPKMTFAKLPTTVLFDPELSPWARLLFAALSWCQFRGQHPTQSELGEQLGLKERAVREHLNALEEAGLIVCSVPKGKRGGRGKAAEYFIPMLHETRRDDAAFTDDGDAKPGTTAPPLDENPARRRRLLEPKPGTTAPPHIYDVDSRPTDRSVCVEPSPGNTHTGLAVSQSTDDGTPDGTPDGTDHDDDAFFARFFELHGQEKLDAAIGFAIKGAPSYVKAWRDELPALLQSIGDPDTVADMLVSAPPIGMYPRRWAAAAAEAYKGHEKRRAEQLTKELLDQVEAGTLDMKDARHKLDEVFPPSGPHANAAPDVFREAAADRGLLGVPSRVSVLRALRQACRSGPAELRDVERSWRDGCKDSMRAQARLEPTPNLPVGAIAKALDIGYALDAVQKVEVDRADSELIRLPSSLRERMRKATRYAITPAGEALLDELEAEKTARATT